MDIPSINELQDKTDCRYSLAVIIAKRARQILESGKANADVDSREAVIKPVIQAMVEFSQDKYTYTMDIE